MSTLLTLSQSANNISETAETLIDVLGLLEPVAGTATVAKTLTSRKINQVQIAFTVLSSY